MSGIQKRPQEVQILFDSARAAEQNAKSLSIRDFINLSTIKGETTPIQKAIHDAVLNSKDIDGKKMPKAIYITDEIIEGCGYNGVLVRQRQMFVKRLMTVSDGIPESNYWYFEEAKIVDCRNKFRELDGKNAAKIIKKDVTDMHYIVTNELFKSVVTSLTTNAGGELRKYTKEIERTINLCINNYRDYVQYSKDMTAVNKSKPITETKPVKPKIKVVGKSQKIPVEDIQGGLDDVIAQLTALRVASDPDKVTKNKNERLFRIYKSETSEYKVTEGTSSSLSQKTKEMEAFGSLVCENKISSDKPVFAKFKACVGDRGSFKNKTFTTTLDEQSIKNIVDEVCSM